MAKEKQAKRWMAMALAAAVATSAMPVTAFAEGVDGEGGTTKTETSTDSAGNKTTTTTTTNADGSSKVESKTENTDGSSSQTTTTTTGEGSASAPKVTITVTVNKDTEGKETEKVESKTTEASDKDVDGIGKAVTETTTTTTTPNGNGGTVEIDVDKKWSATTSETKAAEDTQDKQEHVPGQGGAVSPDTPVEDADKPYPGDPTGTGQDSYENSQHAEVQVPDFVKDFLEGTTITETNTTEGEQKEHHVDATDSKDRPIENSGSVSGSETITNTVTTVTKTEEQLLGADGKPVETGSNSTTTETEYVKDPASDVDLGNPDVPELNPGYAGDVTVGLDREDAVNGVVTNSATVSVYEKVVGQLKAGLVQDIKDDFKKDFGDIVITETKDANDDITKPVSYEATRVDADGNTIKTTVTLTPQTVAIDGKTYVTGYKTEKSEEITPKGSVTIKDETVITDQQYTYDFGDLVVDKDTDGQPVVTTKTVVELPDNMPEEGAVTSKVNEQGHTETTTVEYIREVIDGEEKVTGYKNVVVLTNEAGEVIGGGEDIHNGKKNVVVTTSTKEMIKTTTIDTDTKQTIVTTKEITKNVTTSTATVDVAKLEREVWAKMWGITSDASGTEIESLQSMIDLNGNAAKDLAWINPAYENLTHNKNDQPDDDQIQYIRHILKSDFKVHRNKGDDTTTFIYELVDKTGQKKFYGYCVDMATTAYKGYFYEIENLEDQDYYSSSKNESGAVMNTEATDSLRAVALNGFWGTSSGTGSLNAVKELLKENVGKSGFNLTESEIDNLTEGQALAATQAAMWVYGNSGDKKIVMNDIVQKHVNGNSVSAADDRLIQGLFNVLTSLDPVSKDDQDAGTNILDSKDFLGSTITVLNKAENVTGLTDENGDARFATDVNADDDKTNDVYNANVGFKLAIVPGNHADDNLQVYVMDQNNNIIKTETLKNAHTGDGNYEVKNIQLQEGVTINLSISGTQHLDQGVYLYTSERIGGQPSQTFISVAEGKRNVSLDVNMMFTVDEPEVKTSSSSRKHKESKTETTVTEKTFHDKDQFVSALVEVTQTVTTTVSNEWSGEYNEEWTYNDGGNGGGKDPETPKDPEDPKDPGDPGDPEHFEDIGDNDVPLAGADPEEELADIADEDVPLVAAEDEIIAATGDSNHMAAGFGGMFAALAGMFMLRRKKED